jgi:hypothetical protein
VHRERAPNYREEAEKMLEMLMSSMAGVAKQRLEEEIRQLEAMSEFSAFALVCPGCGQQFTNITTYKDHLYLEKERR